MRHIGFIIFADNGVIVKTRKSDIFFLNIFSVAMGPRKYYYIGSIFAE